MLRFCYNIPMTPQAFIFMGRYGAGKGTQALLLEALLARLDSSHSVFRLETGAEFRKLIEGTGYTARLAKKVVDSGELTPAFMPIYIWGKLFFERYDGGHAIFDGTPRKLDEAKVLGSLFPFYGLEKPWLIYLDVDHEESKRRLTIRHAEHGRKDDHPDAVERRKAAYAADIEPTIAWYRDNPGYRFLDIDGERPIQDIHADIVKRLGLA